MTSGLLLSVLLFFTFGDYSDLPGRMLDRGGHCLARQTLSSMSSCAQVWARCEWRQDEG
jgi:hypothetical protein